MSSSMDIIRKAEKAEREAKKRKRLPPSMMLTRTTEGPSSTTRQSDGPSESKGMIGNFSQKLDIDVKQPTIRESPGSEEQIPSTMKESQFDLNVHNHSSIELGRNDSPLVLVNSFSQYVDQNSAQVRQEPKGDNSTGEALLPHHVTRKRVGFYRDEAGCLMCEGLKVKEI